MALPSGYTQLDFIESSGSQCINTGFKPNGNTRVLMDVKAVFARNTFLFGARTSSTSTDTFSMPITSPTTIRSDYFGTKTEMTLTDVQARLTIDKNKNVTTIGAVATTATASSASLPYDLYLFCANTGGVATAHSRMKLYSCKIYDNGTLVRDFVPCKSDGGAYGLWDNVNGVFYGNSGSYGFIGSDNYAMSLGSKDVGSIVKLNVGGVAKEFIVVHHGCPDNKYDASCNGVWLLMKDVYNTNIFGTNSDYSNSTINTYLNNDFLKLLDGKIQKVVLEVKIPYRTGSSGSTVATGSSGLSTKVFLLSGYEVGFDKTVNSYFPEDGAKLDYFLFGNTSMVSPNPLPNRIAYLNGEAKYWHLRSPYTNGQYNTWTVMDNGACGFISSNTSQGIRPALILPPNLFVLDDGTVYVDPMTPMGKHNTIIGGTSYPITGGKVLVNGTGYDIGGGRTLIGGTGYDINFGLKLGDVPVGQSVYMPVNGVTTEFIVVHQGLPGSMYDSSCDGSWLYMKDAYIVKGFDTTNNDYKNSDIHSYLTNDFPVLLNDNIQNAIKTIKIPYVNGTGKNGSIASGSNGLSVKCFSLSGYEVGFTTGTFFNFPIDGVRLSYFLQGRSTEADALRSANTSYWLRSPSYNSDNESSAWRVYLAGSPDCLSITNKYTSIRPAMVMYPDTRIDSNFNIKG